MENKKGKKPRITPQNYAEILKGLELKSIGLISCKSIIDRENFNVNLSISIKDEATFKKNEEGEIEILHKYRLNGKDTKLKKIAIKIECAFCLTFSSKKNFSQDFFEIFKSINLPVNSWPFFREFIFTLTSKMNIPPLTLPLFKALK